MSRSFAAPPPRRPSRRRLAFVACLFLSVIAFAAFLLFAKSPPSKDKEPQDDGPVWFEDVTDAVGLDFVHDCGPTDTHFMPQSMGSGCAFFDFDGDGLLDIYLLHQGG